MRVVALPDHESPAPPSPVDPDHAARTLDAIRRAVTDVPFYAKESGSLATGTSLDQALRSLPLLTRDRVRATLPKAWVPAGRDVKSELASGKVAVLEAGTSEARVRVLFDAAWWRAQETRALAVNPRAASALAGELGPYRDAVLGVPERGTGSCGAGDPGYEDRLEGHRLHLNSRQDPTFWSEAVMTRMLDELTLHRTVGFLGDPFYLHVLAKHAASIGRKLDARGFVATTRARATDAHRAALRAVYDGVVFDVFGSREAGTLFVEGEDGLLHHAPFTSHVEFLRATVETPGSKDLALVVVTTLDREIQPLVRYVLGDLVQIADAPSKFTTVSPLVSVEGKIDDAIVRPDGAIVTPGAIDRAVAPAELAAYQVVQRDESTVELEAVGGSIDAARDALAPLLTGMKIAARAATAIGAEPNGKYRTARRVVNVPLSRAFEACEGITP